MFRQEVSNELFLCVARNLKAGKSSVGLESVPNIGGKGRDSSSSVFPRHQERIRIVSPATHRID